MKTLWVECLVYNESKLSPLATVQLLGIELKVITF